MTTPDETKPPCEGCGGKMPIYTDGQDYWKFDYETGQYRIVNFYGGFYPLKTHPGTTQQNLLQYFGTALVVATETDILWRSVILILDRLTAENML